MSKKKSIEIGQKFHLLTILELPCNGKIICKCDCGTIKPIRTQAVTNGTTKSCGCYNRMAASKRMTKLNTKYSVDITHKTYNSWKVMKRQGPICSDWIKDYEAFYHWAIHNGWKSGLVLKRHDMNAPYSPANCYWSKRTSPPQNPQKTKETCLRKYGVEHYTQTQEYKDRHKQTCLEKYGVEHTSQSQIVKDKIRQTNLQKYGVECVLQNEEIKQKIKDTCLQKYGTTCALSHPDIKAKSIQTCLAKYGQESYHVPSLKEQNGLSDWLNQYGNFSSNRTILSGKEIDFYDKELGLGIEYCGIYWHNELSPTTRGRLYHWSKYNTCLLNNIRLITIFSDEWIYRQEQVKSFLLSVLDANDKIYARKCTVKNIPSKEAKHFIETHHIQGCKRMPKVAFGLYHQDILVGAMSLNYHPRSHNSLVLDRMVFKQGITVVGGASRLFKMAHSWCQNNNIDKLVTWSDNRWSQGNIYNVLGFDFEEELKPDYSYVNISSPKKRISKQSMSKAKTGCPKDMTEKQWCEQKKHGRIWDCGKKRFSKTIGSK